MIGIFLEVIEVCLSQNGLKNTLTLRLARGNQCVTRVSSSNYLYEYGRRAGLERYISTNPSQGEEAPSMAVVANAVGALLGAVWMDSQQSLSEVRRVIQILDPIFSSNLA